MRRRLLSFPAALLAAGALAPGALADGGAWPGLLHGAHGVGTANGAVRYVALPAGRSTVLAAIRQQGGGVAAWRLLDGVLGVPLVAFDGTAGGLSADGRRLILAELPPPPAPGAHSRLLVLDTRTLRPFARVELPGTFVFDALSPDGSTL